MVISVEPVVNNCCKKCLRNGLRILKTYIKDRTIIDDSVIKVLLNVEELMDLIRYLIRQNMANYSGRTPIAFKRTINKMENFYCIFFYVKYSHTHSGKVLHVQISTIEVL